MLFKNIENMEYIGMFGNSNPHFLSDWIQVTQDSSEKFTSDRENEVEGTCTIPNVMSLQIFYAKLGELDNPQYKIIQAQS
mmetsp:Transcript_4206/g.3090  ORF Transcript_4206/g.3090 Transcript_4206/m.3090 type:complete len:80 (-) Transcript_4206:278-517(-)